ncbi:Putative S- transferase [Salmonella enterica subsp. enterica]|uniref:S- transferase n=1 Tax=Salmonella enterica I TaxID=59201 RepID=A0A447N711_SALET|nr:Putative S- transferase [Salmonella enterica subsp. enterica]
MGEEAVAFAIIIAPLMVRLGYDSITTVLVTYIATQIGFASSWMNPFCVVVAQGIAGVPVLSGSGLRIVVWIVATLIGLVFTLVYASRVKKNPLLSRVHESDRYFREQQDEVVQRPFTFGDWLVLLVLTGVMIWVVWGVIVHAWFIPEIASQFFTMGVVIGLIGVIFPPQRYDDQRDGVLIHRRGEDDDRARLAGGFCQKAFCCWSATAKPGKPQRAQYAA